MSNDSNDLVNQMTRLFYMYLSNSFIIKQTIGRSVQIFLLVLSVICRSLRQVFNLMIYYRKMTLSTTQIKAKGAPTIERASFEQQNENLSEICQRNRLDQQPL